VGRAFGTRFVKIEAPLPTLRTSRSVLTLEPTPGFTMPCEDEVKDGLTVGRVASAAGVTPDAVRYYERLRLISRATRTPSGYRLFDGADVDRVRAIRRAQALGMSLAEIGALFPQGRLGRAECRRVRRLVAEKIAETDARIVDLRKFRHDLRSHLDACDRAIDRGGEVPCLVLAPDAAQSDSRTTGRNA